MSQENQSCLRFSLEESLWFRKGQEVEELVSISLDPDITIQENDQYVTIRGSLQLTGEYKSYAEPNASEDESTTSQKFVELVESREEGGCEFSHRFPVDITIPNNRIQSIYDIDVLVESFDYSLPERSCLKLSAELTISGLYEAQEKQEAPELEALLRSETEEEEEFEQYEHYEPYVNQNNYQETLLFETEARKQQEEESVEILPKFPTFSYEPQEEQIDEQEPSWNFQQVRSEGNKPVEVEEEVVVQEKPAENIHFTEEVTVADESSSSSSEQAPPKQIKMKKAAKKKSMTLTEFFARKEESTDQAKLKVCIVQKGDSVDSLADRYDVSVQNLLRVNNLEINQDVYEGQVLYIPVVYAKK